MKDIGLIRKDKSITLSIEFLLGRLLRHNLFSASASAETKVFLLAGQSNMAGLGGYTGYPLGKPWNDPPYDHADVPCPAPYDKPQTDVKFWNYGAKPGDDHANVLKAGDAWVDLRPGFGHRDDGFGPEVSFGYQLKKLFPKDDIYLIKSSTGGTNLAADWNPNPDSMGPQYKLFKSRVDAALANLTAAGKKPTIVGMIWMQGEDDSTNPAFAKAYGDNLKNFIAKVRSDYKAPEMKFVIGRITYMAVAGWATPANHRYRANRPAKSRRNRRQRRVVRHRRFEMVPITAITAPKDKSNSASGSPKNSPFRKKLAKTGKMRSR